MSELTDEVCTLIDQASDDERLLILKYLRQRVPLHALEKEWATTAEAILTPIARSSDLTLRGFRGILAEATFEAAVLPETEAAGWKTTEIVGDHAYDFLLEKDATQIKIQVKLQRSEKHEAKEYAARARRSLKCPAGSMYVVEVQKTRSGKKKGKATRPYQFGDFDILAVNLHPSTGDWKRFMFTIGSWLLPRDENPELIKIFQPVPACADDYWTDDLKTCIAWFLSGEEKKLYS